MELEDKRAALKFEYRGRSITFIENPAKRKFDEDPEKYL
jgi:YHS domain-containing protein